MKTRLIMIAIAAVGAVFRVVASSDAELMERIVGYLRPHCGGNHVEGEEDPELAEILDMGSDTNRLAGLLVELARTNDNWNANMAMWQLEKYGTPAQLPFLYSCATNPVVGHRAVKAVMRIEGVTSNSLSVAQSYVSLTNGFPLMKTDDRPDLCRGIVTKVFEDEGLSVYRPFVMDIACSFAANVNVIPKGLDKTLVAVDPDFRFTKRRLAILRATQARLNERFQGADTNSVHFSAESHIHDVQTNYLTSAINELVAYPEANLPD